MKKYLVICLLLTISCNFYSQETVTLKHCLETALERNYSIRITKNEEKIANNNATIGNAGYLPTVNLEGGLSGSIYDNEYDYRDNITTKENNVNNNTANAGINLNWTIFDGFGIQAEYSRLKELENMGELNTRIVIEDMATNIAAEYYNLIRQSIRLRNLRSAVTLSKERLRIVEERYLIGSMSRLELQQAKVDFNTDSSKIFTQTEAVYTSQTMLNELMGLDSVEQRFRVSDTIILNNPLLEKSDLWNKTFENNALLLASHSNKALSEIDLKKLRSRNYPYLRANAGYGVTNYYYEAGTVELQKRLGLNYGVTVGLNLFDGFNRRREQRNARIHIENNNLRTQSLEQSLRSDLSNLWMSYLTNLELRKLEKENLKVAKENHEIAIERYKLGNLSGIELREAQNNLLEAEERQSIAEYNTKICEISLMQLSGQILTYLLN
jgi:outer membrane protein TolC